MTNLLVRRLRHGATLREDDERVLNGLAGPIQHLVARHDIIREESHRSSLIQIVEGWACKYRDLPDGRRQIIGFLLPGDLCEHVGALPRVMACSLGALTSVSFVRLAIGAARSTAGLSPAIVEALEWDAVVSNARLQERVVSLGQRSALERLAHLICELHLRLMLVDLADASGFDLPLTQHDLGHALGLSVVHVNRSLKALRQTGAISLSCGRLTIRDLDELRDLAAFDSAFFHLRGIMSEV